MFGLFGKKEVTSQDQEFIKRQNVSDTVVNLINSIRDKMNKIELIREGRESPFSEGSYDRELQDFVNGKLDRPSILDIKAFLNIARSRSNQYIITDEEIQTLENVYFKLNNIIHEVDEFNEERRVNNLSRINSFLTK